MDANDPDPADHEAGPPSPASTDDEPVVRRRRSIERSRQPHDAGQSTEVQRRHRTRGLATLGVALLAIAVAILGYVILIDEGPSPDVRALPTDGPASGSSTTVVDDTIVATPTSLLAEPQDLTQIPADPVGSFVNPASSGRMWSATVPGILTFRGNPTRSYYGRGPVPTAPGVRWFYPPSGGMCSSSSVGGESKTWCGSGWTGQPGVFERDGRTWVVFGAYDRAVHFMDGETGEEILPPIKTGDIIKGSVTIDPDGYPLVYSGSRDGFYHLFAIDRDGRAEELWKLSARAVSPTLWNDDWDGAGLVLDDFLFIGGENSQFHAVKLNRSYGADGRVVVDPQLVFNTPSWDQQVIDDLAGNRAKEMSIENSVAVSGDVVYWANSGGLVMGWDVGPLRDGGTPVQTFRFWTGDDTDASIVIDPDGFLYVAVEYERGNKRSEEVGQLMKLDPSKPDDPLVWKYDDRGSLPAGFWATPALHNGVVIAPTDGGKVVGLDQNTGRELWTFQLMGPTWQSPVVVDDVLIQGDCVGVLHGFDVSDPRVVPPELWSVDVGGCIESTPSVWKGRIYFGTRAGRFFSFGDDGETRSPTAGS